MGASEISPSQNYGVLKTPNLIKLETLYFFYLKSYRPQIAGNQAL